MGKVHIRFGDKTGAIALALASEAPDRNVWGVDLKQEAQHIAQENAERLSIKNAQFLFGSWFEPLDHDAKFALIVSNPPYMRVMILICLRVM